jgi:signal transduction histidine kinase
VIPSNIDEADKTLKPLKETAGPLEVSRRTYDDVVNRLSHELGSPIAVLRGYLSFWLDGSLDPVPWSTREDVVRAAAQVEGLAKQAVALVDLFSRSSVDANRRALDSWPADADRTLAGPVHELRGWFQAKDRATLQQLSTESHTAVLICERSVIVLEALVRQIATAHMVSGDEMPEMESIDLLSWLRRTVHELAPSVTCFGHPFSLDCPPGPVPIQGNSTLLAVALLNLLDNAQKFSHPRSPIQVVGYERAGVCGFAVEDGGPGLPRDFEFRAFGRIDHGLGFAAPGVGLGLFTAKRIAELHGGSLTIRAIEHRGTRVGIQLPASRSV